MPGLIDGKSLGLIETIGLVGAIEACDAAAKTADVVISAAEVTDAAFVTLKIFGDLGAVQAAVEAGAKAAMKVGQLLAAHVIPNPDNGLDTIMGGVYNPSFAGPGKPPVPSSTKPKSKSPKAPNKNIDSFDPHTPFSLSELDKMPVIMLRRFARTIPNLSIKGREISRADRNTLLKEINKARGNEPNR